jgi:TolA-binding protein
MTVSDPSQDGGGDLKRRLAEISRDRLIDEVVSRWEDVNKMEGDIANLRRRLREAELVARSDGSDGVLVGELEERIRVSDSRVRQLEGLVQNEKSRREGAEAEASRLAELQKENGRLLRNEEELLLLVLDMEAQIDRLTQENVHSS